jgi:hypothetical protein
LGAESVCAFGFPFSTGEQTPKATGNIEHMEFVIS